MSPVEIKALRKTLKWTQAEMAAAMEVWPTQVSRWERGIQEPTPFNVKKMRKMLESPA